MPSRNTNIYVVAAFVCAAGCHRLVGCNHTTVKAAAPVAAAPAPSAGRLEAHHQRRARHRPLFRLSMPSRLRRLPRHSAACNRCPLRPAHTKPLRLRHRKPAPEPAIGTREPSSPRALPAANSRRNFHPAISWRAPPDRRGHQVRKIKLAAVQWQTTQRRPKRPRAKNPSFLAQSREAGKAGDWSRAQTLAQKARRVSVELVASF